MDKMEAWSVPSWPGKQLFAALEGGTRHKRSMFRPFGEPDYGHCRPSNHELINEVTSNNDASHLRFVQVGYVAQICSCSTSSNGQHSGTHTDQSTRCLVAAALSSGRPWVAPAGSQHVSKDAAHIAKRGLLAAGNVCSNAACMG